MCSLLAAAAAFSTALSALAAPGPDQARESSKSLWPPLISLHLDGARQCEGRKSSGHGHGMRLLRLVRPSMSPRLHPSYRSHPHSIPQPSALPPRLPTSEFSRAVPAAIGAYSLLQGELFLDCTPETDVIALISPSRWDWQTYPGTSYFFPSTSPSAFSLRNSSCLA
jgi:hypothetical protein